jgi:hypothetical protein
LVGSAQIGLRGHGMFASRMGDGAWGNEKEKDRILLPTIDALLASRYRARLGNADVDMLTAGQFPANFVFQTRKGRIGILQIVGFTDKPKAVRICYRLVQDVRSLESGLAKEKARSEEPSAALRAQIATQISAEYQRELERMQQKAAALQHALKDADKRLKGSAENSTRGAQPSELEREIQRLQEELDISEAQTRAFEKEVAEKKREADSAPVPVPNEKTAPGASKPETSQKQETKWTPENIKKDPASYLRWAIDQSDATKSKLEAAQLALTKQRRDLSDNLQAVSTNKSDYEAFLKELMEAYKKAVQRNDWPVEVRNHKFDSSELKRTIVECGQGLENATKMVETYTAAIRQVTDRLDENDGQRTKVETLRKKLATDLEAAKVQQALEGIESARSNSDDIVNTSKRTDKESTAAKGSK